MGMPIIEPRRLTGRSLAVLCALAMLLCACMFVPARSWAASGTTDDGWAYQTSDAGAVLTGYTGSSLTPAVPQSVSGTEVTEAVVNAGAGAPAITSIDVSAAASTLTSLKVYGCALGSLDVSGCGALTYVDVRNNKLTSLKVPASIAELLCSGNELSALDVSACSSLERLLCADNKLESLNVSTCPRLYYLDCHSNLLTTLNVSLNLDLNDLICYDNYLSDDVATLAARYGRDANVVLPQNTKESNGGDSGASGSASNSSGAQQQSAAKTVTAITLNKAKKITAADVKKALGKHTSTVKTVTLGKKVKGIGKKAFKGTKITKLVLKTKKLKKKSVKKALSGSKIKTVQVEIGSKKTNKKYIAKYKKLFTKKACGKSVKVK